MSTATYLRTADVPLARLRPFPGNAKRGNVPTILESLCRTGQYRSLVVRQGDGDELTTLAGNHTAQAIAAHGPGDCGLNVTVDGEQRPCGLCLNAPWEPVARCEIVTCDDATAKRINLVDNRAADQGDYDERALAALIAGMDGDLAGTGYSDADLQDLLAPVDLDADVDAYEPPARPAAATRPPADLPPGPAPGEPAPPAPDGHATVLLTYTTAEHDEVAAHMAAARNALPTAGTPVVVLHALRTLTATLNARDAARDNLAVDELLAVAGVAA
ncbi:hypothetical protein [Streptomyces sp. NRRL B-1347]|uniref:hypothetical protein n=1 Tax=Streptomyces sp. NRRL B-1347 TaxID=1476877 RepID=UPI00068A8A28|nr:hypothetical protein [Streptomyces sp. NRRL B-1347]